MILREKYRQESVEPNQKLLNLAHPARMEIKRAEVSATQTLTECTIQKEKYRHNVKRTRKNYKPFSNIVHFLIKYKFLTPNFTKLAFRQIKFVSTSVPPRSFQCGPISQAQPDPKIKIFPRIISLLPNRICKYCCKNARFVWCSFLIQYASVEKATLSLPFLVSSENGTKNLSVQKYGVY